MFDVAQRWFYFEIMAGYIIFLYPGSLEELGVGKSESKMSSESKGENQTTKLVFVRDKTDKSRT